MPYIDKVWITGANGRLGSELVRFLNPYDFEVLTNDIDDLDITNIEDVSIFADINRPKVIINCASITNVLECENNPEYAFRINALGARNIAVVANKIKAKLVHLSTDNVFDGSSSIPYKEFDKENPSTVYGESKLLGEKFIRDLCTKFFIIRSSWIYTRSSNFINNLIENAKKGNENIVAKNQISSPTSASELAKFIVKIMNTSEYGIYHASCEGVVSRREFAEFLLEQLNLPVNVKEEEKIGDRIYKPDYSVLDNFLLRVGGLYTFPNWKDDVKRFVKEEVIER